MKEPQILSTFQEPAAPTPRRRARGRANAVLVFDACQPGVVLRAVLFVETVMAVGAMFGSNNLLQWAERLALLTAGAMPATLLWLLVACIAVPLGWQLPRRLTARIVPAMLWPDGRLVLIAALGLLMLATDWLAKRGLIPYTLRWSEVEEVFFAYGWLIYSVMLLGLVRSPRQAGSM